MMRRTATRVIVLTLLVGLAVPVMAREPSMYARDYASWRTDRLEKLEAPQGWLRLAGLLWLKPGVNTLGAAADSDARFPEGAPDRIGTVTVADGRHVLTLAEGLAGTLAGQPFVEGRLTTDADPVTPPDLIELGRFSFKIILRGGRAAVRLYDDQAESFTSFRGIDTFTLDKLWRVEARYERFDPPRIVEVSTAISTTQTVTIPGRFHFRVGDRDLTLDPFEYEGEDDLYLMFGDRTNGKTTYGGGRFLLVARPEGETAVLDFNRAYNPPCAYSAYATCPLPRRENRLPIPVTAGEKHVDPDHP